MAGRETLCIFFVAIFMVKLTLQSLQDDIELRINDTEKSLLSRKRRYLIFPEGSSLQLVFCLTIPSIGVGSIFTVGSTAALAWELPHDPFVPFRRPSELLHRVDKPGKDASGGWTVQNSNTPSSVSYKKTYYNPFLINNSPFATYNTINGLSPKLGFTPIDSRKSNHYSNQKTQQYSTSRRSDENRYNQFGKYRVVNEPVTTYIHPVYHQVYRRTRRDLYGKIERLFTALSKDGRACLLKSICEVSKATQERGTFMEEIIKAIFRVRHRHDNSEDEKDHYDLASNKQHNCTEMYPTCEHSIWTGMFSFA